MSEQRMPNGDDHAVLMRQVSVFLENELGKLAEVIALLADRGLNLSAVSIAETERFGILRLIVDDPDAAVAALADLGVTTKVVEVVAVEVPNRPGGLAEVLNLFNGTGVSVHYMYAEMGGDSPQAVLIMRLDPVNEALAILSQAGIYG